MNNWNMENSAMNTGSLKAVFPRAVFIAEIMVLSEPMGGTRKFWNTVKESGPLKGLLQEQSEWAKKQNTSEGGGGEMKKWEDKAWTE